MSDKNRFKKRRAFLRSRGLCVRCGTEKAAPGHVKCKKCASEIGAKKLVAPSRRLECKRIGRLEEKKALFAEAIRVIDSELVRRTG